MLATALPHQAAVEKTIERIRRAARSLRVRDSQAERRRLFQTMPRKAELNNLIDRKLAYGMLPERISEALPAAIKFAQQVREERRNAPAKKKADYNPTILDPKRYEDAPALFDLILSDEILQIASDYLGEIPVLMSVKLWCTPQNDHLKGSQLFHLDNQKWLLRRSKFLINMDDVDSDCGPFTFLPGDVSERISRAIGTMKLQGRVPDKIIYEHCKPEDTISLIGKAGTGGFVDSSRCFHFGARVRKGERLLLQFNFLSLADAVHGGTIVRTKAFDERFGNDRIRQLVIPNRDTDKTVVQDDED